MIPRRLLWGLVLVGLLGSFFQLAERRWAEQQNTRVEIVFDFSSLAELAVARQLELPELLARLKEQGFSSVALHEMNLEELLDQGRVLLFRGLEYKHAPASLNLPPYPEGRAFRTFLYFDRPQLCRQVQRHLEILFPGAVTRLGERVLATGLDQRALRTLGLGFDPETAEMVHQAGWSLWLRPENSPGLTADQVQELLAAMPEPAQGVIFAGGLNEALGYPDALDTTADALESKNLKLGYIELSPGAQQKGIETLVRRLPLLTVRLQAVSPAHQAKLEPYRVAAMYSLGARERNIRLLYLRPYPEPGQKHLNDELFSLLLQERFERGQATTYPTDSPNSLLGALLVALGGCAAFTLLLLQRYAAPTWLQVAILLAGPVLALLGPASGKPHLVAAVLALGIAISTSALAVVSQFDLLHEVSRKQGLGAQLAGGWLLLLRASSISLAGALMTASLLHERTYLLGLDRFRGVKLLTFGVPLLCGLLYFLEGRQPSEFRALLERPLKWGHALLAIGCTLVGFVFLLRTGNQAAGTASDSERVLRVVLDQALGVRPRFKEFMMSHPLLMALPRLRQLGAGDVLWLGVVVAAMGQSGMVDTFAHIHTPLDVSLIRSVLGVLLGGAVGSLVLVGLHTLFRSR